MTTTARRDPEHGHVARLIGMSARRPFVTLLLCAALGLFGARAMHQTPLDALPDLSDVQVIVLTEWPGRSPDLVEDQLTFPISSALLAAPKVKHVRGQSFFGLSFVYVIFEDDTDLYWARSRVLEELNTLGARLPRDAVPTMGPDATGVGWVFQYALVDRSGRHDLQQLRTLQDWNLRFALESIPGVAEVASIGGFVKQVEVVIDPVALRGYRLTQSDVVRAVRQSNIDVGGRTLELSGHEFVIRGRGYVRTPADVEQAVLRADVDTGRVVKVGDVAKVVLGAAPRRGFADLDGEGEVVGGIVIMRYGENALHVIRAVKERLETLKPGLPDGVELVTTYDRSSLIEEAIATLTGTLVEEMVIVALVILLFLLHVRSALVPILTLPLGVLLAFLPLQQQGLTASIMSLGGIAIAIGAMVDASIVILENIHKHLEEWECEPLGRTRGEVVVAAMQEVGPSIFFSLLVITVSFLPVFTLEGVEGRLFKPLAFTKTYAMGAAAILAVTATPALVALFLRGRVRSEADHPLSRILTRAYAPLVRAVVRARWPVLGGALSTVALIAPLAFQLPSEFMPPLNEGAVLYMPSAPPGMSMTEAGQVLQSMDRELRAIPEVERVFGKMGRARTATDPAPIGMAETTVLLKPRGQWRPGLTFAALVEEMDRTLRYPGMPNLFWMPIQTRTEMLSTGVRSPLGVQVFGASLAEIEAAAVEVEAALSRIPGTRSAFAERATGGYYVDIEVDRVRAARVGLSVAEVQDVVMTAIGGAEVAETVEGRERYPIAVRFGRELRETPAQLAQILVTGPGGVQLPLSDVATVKERTGPPMVRSESGQLVSFVFVDTDRPIAEYVEEARRAVSEKVSLPAGVRLEWVGQFKHLERARERLRVVVPLTLVLVLVLLYFNTGRWSDTLLIVAGLPFSLAGAVFLLWWLDYHLSVAVWVGLIALAGVDAETSVVMLLYLRLSVQRRIDRGQLSTSVDLEDAIVEGAAYRLRPKLMTVMTTILGLLPLLWNEGAGADVMQRLAAPMVGGLVTSFLLELFVFPALFAAWQGRRLLRAMRAPAGDA